MSHTVTPESANLTGTLPDRDQRVVASFEGERAAMLKRRRVGFGFWFPRFRGPLFVGVHNL